MSEGNPNTILELNATHSKNFILVIPEIPTLEFIGSAFTSSTIPDIVDSDYPSTTQVSAAPECGDGPEFVSSNFNTDNITAGTTGTSGTEDTCPQLSSYQIEMQKIREMHDDLRNFKLFVTEVNMPGVSIDTVRLGTQFSTMSRSSKIQFTDFTTSMIISENLINYNAILFWMYALHNPEYRNTISGRKMIEKYYQDIYLIITNNHREKIAEYKFIDAFPIDMPSLPWSWQEAEKITIPVTWAHSGMFITNNFVLKYV